MIDTNVWCDFGSAISSDLALVVVLRASRG